MSASALMDTQVTLICSISMSTLSTFIQSKSPLQGNGIQCFDANGTMAVSGDAHVELEMTLTSQVRILLNNGRDNFVSRWRHSPLTPALTFPLEWSFRI